MSKILVVTNGSELVEEILTDGWNLDKALGRAAFMDEIMDALKVAKAKEAEELCG